MRDWPISSGDLNRLGPDQSEADRGSLGLTGIG